MLSITRFPWILDLMRTESGLLPIWCSVMKLSDSERRVLEAVDKATRGGRAATFEEIGQVADQALGLRDALSKLEHLDPPLVERPQQVAQYYRAPHPPPMGEHRWQLTEDGREVLRSTAPPA